MNTYKFILRTLQGNAKTGFRLGTLKVELEFQTTKAPNFEHVAEKLLNKVGNVIDHDTAMKRRHGKGLGITWRGGLMDFVVYKDGEIFADYLSVKEEFGLRQRLGKFAPDGKLDREYLRDWLCSAIAISLDEMPDPKRYAAMVEDWAAKKAQRLTIHETSKSKINLGQQA